MMDTNMLKKRAAGAIDTLASELRATSLEIHAHPEVGYQERQASALLAGRLEKAGFVVERGVAGMETAFVARYPTHGQGPTVALLAEYDALPGLGHACGHNIIATAALGAALGLKAVLDDVVGTLVVVGSPAEELVIGKIRLVEAGVFKGIDAAMMLHPGPETQLGRLTLAMTNVELIFHGKSSHAAAGPEQGINALDACIATFNGLNALKKHLRDDVRLHGVILEGGMAANIVPERARAVFGVRARDRAYLESVLEKVRACAQGGAMTAGATVEVNVPPICAEVKDNRALAEAFGRNAASLGHRVLPLYEGSVISTDMGNVSQVVPAIHPILKIHDGEIAFHSREFATAAASEQAQEYMLDGAKMLAMTALDVWTDPQLLHRAKEEFGQ